MKPSFRKSFVVAIGIDHYQNGIPELRSAVNDAQRLGDILKSDHGYECISLLDAEADSAALENLLIKRLPESVQADDRVVFYFAGHGVALDGEDGPRGFVLPRDAVPGRPDTYLEMTHLHDALMALPCRHMLVVLDSCFAGAFRWSTTRDVMKCPEVIHQERFNRFILDPAWQVLTSAGYDQTAADQLQSGSLGARGGEGEHSPFALALFDGLTGAADLVPEGGDGLITATELYLYLENRLQPETLERGCRQTPGLWPLRKHDKGEFVFLVPGKDLDLPAAPELNYDNNPYRGLSSYNKEDAELFFGRKAAVEELARRVENHRLTVVLGASGSGKSSLVKAGLIPVMEKSGYGTLPVMRPGVFPMRRLAGILSGKETKVPATREGIISAFKCLQQDENRKTLLIIDQFEELITRTRSEESRTAFIALLSELVTECGPDLRIILTVRIDYEAHFAQSDLETFWTTGRYVVPALTRQDYREIIEEPASRRVIYFDPPTLIETLLDDVAAMPGGLPLLSFTLSEMYRKYIDRGADDRALTQSDYDALGGVVGSLRTRADEEFERLDNAQRDSLRRVMLRMVVMEYGMPARQRVSRDELEHWDPRESERIKQVLRCFSDARLLVEGVADEGLAYVEPAHEALVSSWGRLLDWLHTAQAGEPDLHFLHTLSRTSLDWKRADKRSKPGLLWRDKLHSTRLWALRKSRRIQFNRIEDEFCRASVARRRFIRNSIAALLIVIAMTGVLAALLGFSAMHQARLTWASSLTAKAGVALNTQGDATMGLKLAIAALQVDPDNERAAWLLRRAIYGDRLFTYEDRIYTTPLHKEIGQFISRGRWSPDGNHIVLLRQPGYSGPDDVLIISPDGEISGQFAAEQSNLGHFSQDGQFYLGHFTEHEQYSLRKPSAWGLSGQPASDEVAASLQPAPLYEINIGRRAGAYPLRDAAPPGGSMGTDISISLSATDQIEIFEDEDLMTTIPGRWDIAAMTQNGQYVATGSDEGLVTLWRVIEDESEVVQAAILWRQNMSSSGVTDLKFSPGDQRLLVVWEDGVARVWNLVWNPLNRVYQDISLQEVAAKSCREDLREGECQVGRFKFQTTARYWDPLLVTDRSKGTTWLLKNWTDLSFAVLGDMVVLQEDISRYLPGVDGLLWLINPQGVPEARISLPELESNNWEWTDLHTENESIRLKLGWEDGNFLDLPMSPRTLIRISEGGGYSNLTATEQSLWDTTTPDSLNLVSLLNNMIPVESFLQYFGRFKDPSNLNSDP